MRMTIGAKDWTWDDQQGLRLYAGAIRALAPHVNVPDQHALYPTMQAFVDAVNAGRGNPAHIERYSRNVIIVGVDQTPLECTSTFARNPGATYAASVQGYVTAPRGSWFHHWVSTQLDQDLRFDYQPGTTYDILLIL